MINKNKKRMLHTILALTCVVTIASSEILVYAAPSTKELEKKTSDLQGKINSLNSEMSVLVQELEETSSQVETLAAEVEQAKLNLAAAKMNEELQYEAMKDRIKFMYEGGNTNLLHILFTSTDMGDFLSNAEYVTTISEYDRNMLEEFQAVCEKVEEKQAELNKQQEELASLQKNLTSQRDALSKKISSASGELSQYESQLAKARAAEEALKRAQDEQKTSTSTDTNKNTSSKDDAKDDSDEDDKNSSSSSSTANVDDVVLLAAILQCEAGGSGYDGMLAVATVIMNRVASSRFPNTIRGVIYQSGQFSPTWNGSLERVLSRGPSSTAYSVAKDALAGKRHSKVKNCYYFNAAWTGRDGINVGGNVFW